jgi:small subunit ribosomal protein S6
MRIYEELFILRPDATEEEIDAQVEQMRHTIVNGGGTVDKVDKWGLRKLAYRVGKKDEGFYILVVFTADAQLVKEIERRLRVSDVVLKFLTVRIDEKLKWLEKRKKIRDKRAARRPAPALMPAAPAAGPGAPLPGAPAPAGPTPGAPMPGAPVASPPVPPTPPVLATVEEPMVFEPETK